MDTGRVRLKLTSTASITSTYENINPFYSDSVFSSNTIYAQLNHVVLIEENAMSYQQDVLLDNIRSRASTVEVSIAEIPNPNEWVNATRLIIELPNHNLIELERVELIQNSIGDFT